MTVAPTRKTKQLHSLIRADGTLELTLTSVDLPPPSDEEVMIEVKAAAINPSDIGLMFGAADLSTATASGSPAQPILTAQVPPAALATMNGRIGKPLPLGNEGAGVVVQAGKSPTAQALLGKTVAAVAGGMYATHRIVAADQCLVLPEGVPPVAAASALVNPLTALGMLDTMRAEGHHALVHTAAASSLGQILNRLCIKDGVELISIVRSEEQRQLLLSQGARYVIDSTLENFSRELVEALEATGATIAFDATGGGTLASDILNCMEVALSKSDKQYSRYGSTTHKQLYLYGGLDTRPTSVTRHAGMSWGIGGWILFGHLAKIGKQAVQQHRERIAREITTTFASSYVGEISLADALNPEFVKKYTARSTGGKYVIDPGKA